MSTTSTPGALAAQIHRLTPMAHVADVEKSAAFYGLLGFKVVNRLKWEDGRTRWAMLHSQAALLMLALASGPVDPSVQAVLFYFYTQDLATLRKNLLAAGVRDAGKFDGTPRDDRGVVFDITYPPYMQEGELRVHDLDGYCLLIGQAD